LSGCTKRQTEDADYQQNKISRIAFHIVPPSTGIDDDIAENSKIMGL